jgi:hypothetical protein
MSCQIDGATSTHFAKRFGSTRLIESKDRPGRQPGDPTRLLMVQIKPTASGRRGSGLKGVVSVALDTGFRSITTRLAGTNRTNGTTKLHVSRRAR